MAASDPHSSSLIGAPVTVELSSQELMYITDVLRDVADLGLGWGFTDAWVSRIRPIRERFDRVQKLLFDNAVVFDRLAHEGVKIREQ